MTGWSGNATGFITEMGILPPTEQATGILSQVVDGFLNTVIDSLHRPVYTVVHDWNKDGKDEILVCEYGNQTVKLTLLIKDKNGDYKSWVLLDRPGIISAIPQDMNKDGKTDIVLLTAQGDEGVMVLFQENDLKFEAERVIQLSPVYGTSWMQLVDYEGDGDMDIIIVNGDNADLSYTQKPYHGVRIFLNNGANKFTENYFYPIFGATRVAAHDFDKDGDIDLAICAYFPDYTHLPEESFVYLENKNPLKFEFIAHTFPEATKGRWLVMETGDFDADGDVDIMLGSFTHAPSPTPDKFMLDWRDNGVDMLLLKNGL